MHPFRPKASLSQSPINEINKTANDFVELIASQLGQRALNIYADIKKYKQIRGDLQQYDFPEFHYKPEPTESNLCAKILNKKTRAFKCHDCIFENNSIMCVDCFEASDHKGHVYEVIEVAGGCCDCGDEQKWNPKGFCKYHSNSNLVDDMKKRVNRAQEKSFVYDLGFCFTYWFILYDDAQLSLKKSNSSNSVEYISKMKDVSHFGLALLEYLNQFNKNSLISNIMTYNLLMTKLEIDDFELNFCQNASKKPIFEIILHMVKLSQCAEQTINLFTHLFTLRYFRRNLTISFFNLHHDKVQFAMSEFNHLSCQLLTSHMMITELVTTKQIPPLIYKPKKEHVKSFEQLAQSFVRYYIDMEYLASLYKDSSQKYLNYHILSGEFPSLGYYKSLSYELDESINYFGIEQIRFARVIKILNVVKNSNQCLPVLQKAIQDLWQEFMSLYKTWNKDLFQDNTYEVASIKNIYLTHQLTWAMTVFMYFQKLQENDPILTEEGKIINLIRILGLDKVQSSIQKVKQTIEVLNSNLVFTGLTLGHPQTMDRYYTYYSFTFKKSLSTLTCTLYMYKIMVKLLHELNKKFNSSKSPVPFISDNFIFERPLKTLEFMFDNDQFAQGDQSIFDRKKNMIRLTFFMHLLIQASQTDIHELILASFFDFTKKEKYEKKLNKFYIEILKNYKKLPLKEFKQIIDSFFSSDEIEFEKFISTSKQILIEHGKISLKNSEPSKGPQSKSTQETNKVDSELNPFYFKSLKGKLLNLKENQTSFKLPSSSNHLLHQILSDSFVSRLLNILSAYTDIIVMKGGKIKERQSATLGLFAIELIKVQKALKTKHTHETSTKISMFFKGLKQNKTALSIFTEEVIKIICSQTEEPNQELNSSLQNLNEEAEFKAEERKRKLQLKKQKMKAKFKENQQKFEDAYAIQLQKIRKQLDEEEDVKIQSSLQTSKSCIVCKQNSEKDKFNSDLMLMGFMQLSDVYEHFLKGKHEKAQNCHLSFKTCGHYIHQKCHQNINKNKQYTFCQLCKSPVNCLFPVSSSLYQQTEVSQKDIEVREKKLYEDLTLHYSLLFAIDDGLRQDCENGFGSILTDQCEFKQKLIDSLVIDIIFSAIVNKDNNGGFFNKRQLQIYQNILYGLRIFCKGQREDLKKQKSAAKRQEIEAETQKNKINKFVQERQLFNTKMKAQQNKQKRKTMEITYMMQNYLKKSISYFIQGEKQNMFEEKSYLSKQCIRILDHTLEQIIRQNLKSGQQSIKVQSKIKDLEIEYNYGICSQIKLLREQVKLYEPPKQLQKLIEMRGKCPNCQNFTNHIFVCIICQWKGCKTCKQCPVYKHTSKMHAGNSIYIEANLGNVYLVTKKKCWVYNSMYTDYLGESFKAYVNGMKLEKYSMSQQRWNNHVTKTILDYDIDTRIRYEEYNTKRSFTGAV